MQFNVVMSLNDRAAIGALAAIKDQGVTDKIAIYGVDGSPDIKNFLGRCDKGFIKLTSFSSFFPEKISQLQRVAKRIHFILALPNPAIQIGVISLVMALPVLLNIERVGNKREHYCANRY